MKDKLKRTQDALREMAMIFDYFSIEEQIILEEQKEDPDPARIGALVEEKRDLQIKIDACIAKREADIVDP